MILSILSKRPESGYGIWRLLSTKLSHIWRAGLQQIYRELVNLHEESFVEAVESRRGRKRKIYTLTSKGREALGEWLSQPPAVPVSKDGFLARLYALPLTPADVVLRRLEERREIALGRERQIRSSLEEDGPSSDGANDGYVFTLWWAFEAAEAELAWIDRVQTYILSRAGDPETPRLRLQGSPYSPRSNVL